MSDRAGQPFITCLKSSHGRLGLGLIAVFWPLNWLLPDDTARTAYFFFPLWLGYILTVDALVLARTGSSLWTRSRADFVMLFVASVPGWWLFEMINWRTENWEYLGGERFTGLQYFCLSSLSFSTVMPAVFETAELVRSFRWLDRLARGPRLVRSRHLPRGLLAAGLVMLALVLLWPRYAYPLVWTSIYLLLEPVNVWLKRRNLVEPAQAGDWRPIISLALGALICGFFWELWNFHSFPKWIYHTPGAEFLRIFEMPLLGYGGYLPFALELYALKNLLWPRAVVRI